MKGKFQVIYGYISVFSIIFIIISVFFYRLNLNELFRSLISLTIVFIFLKIKPISQKGPFYFSLELLYPGRKH